jgi:hypothetical protein
MKKFILAAAVALGLSSPVMAAGVNVGTLACQVDSGVGAFVGSSRDLVCAFHPVRGRTQIYRGSLTHVGVDIGFTSGTTVVWAVVAPGSIKHGALAGHYVGASAEATVGVGGGINVLVGGIHHSFTLQPVSVQGQIGLNVALAAASLDLHAAK